MHRITHNTDTGQRDVGRCKFVAFFLPRAETFLDSMEIALK